MVLIDGSKKIKHSKIARKKLEGILISFVFSGGQKKSHLNCQNTGAHGTHIPRTDSIKLNASLYSIVTVISATFFSLQR